MYSALYSTKEAKGNIDCLQTAIDALSDWRGLKAIPSLCSLKLESDVVVLDVPGYSQTDSFSCGAVAGCRLSLSQDPNSQRSTSSLMSW